MDFLVLLANPNPTTLLLLGGVALLLVNILYGVFRAWRGHLKAGWFTVFLAIVACVLIGAGTVRSAVALSRFGQAQTGNFRNGTNPRGTASPTAPTDPAAGGATPVATIGTGATAGAPVGGPNGKVDLTTEIPRALPTNTPRAPQLVAQNSTPVDAATSDATALATPAATRAGRSGTPGAKGSGRNGGATANGTPGIVGGGNTGSNSNAPTDNASPLTGTNGTGRGNAGVGNFAQVNQMSLSAAEIGGAACVVLALILYLYERRRSGFEAAGSRGLLNAGAGFFALVAILVIPLIPGELSGSATAAAAGSPRTNGPAAARVVPTATPTTTPLPTQTPTTVPSLTPTLTDTPIVLATPISYLDAQPTITPTELGATQCSVTATTNLNLRGDPSTTLPAIASVPAGTSLVVTGMTKDKQWLQVTYSAKSLDGWVSAQYASSIKNCSLPVIQATAKP